MLNNKTKKKKRTGGQLAQGAQAPQGGRSTFGRKDSVFMPKIAKKKPLKRTGIGTKSIKQRIKEDGEKQRKPLKRPLKGDQHKLPQEIKDAIKAAPTKRMKYCGGKSKPFKRKKY